MNLRESMMEDHFGSDDKSNTNSIDREQQPLGAGRSGLRKPKTISNSLRAVTEPKERDPLK